MTFLSRFLLRRDILVFMQNGPDYGLKDVLYFIRKTSMWQNVSCIAYALWSWVIIYLYSCRLQLVQHQPIEFNELANITTTTNWRFMKDNVALLTSFKFLNNNTTLPTIIPSTINKATPAKSNESPDVVVATTHLYWDPNFADVKAEQAKLLLKKLHAFAAICGGKVHLFVCTILTNVALSAKCPVIAGGDFNSVVDSDVYRFLKNDRYVGLHAGAPTLIYVQFQYEQCVFTFWRASNAFYSSLSWVYWLYLSILLVGTTGNWVDISRYFPQFPGETYGSSWAIITRFNWYQSCLLVYYFSFRPPSSSCQIWIRYKGWRVRALCKTGVLVLCKVGRFLLWT